jgi:hypothetical protein
MNLSRAFTLDIRLFVAVGCSLGKSIAGVPGTLAAIKKALEKAGVEFTNGKRPGARPPKKESPESVLSGASYSNSNSNWKN